MTTNIDEIIASVANLSIESSDIPCLAMTADIKIRPLDLIPEFDGTPHKLYRFISIADETLEQYWDRTNETCTKNVFIFNSIVGKLRGHAEEIVSISGANTWPLIKSTLLTTFGDQRDENALLADLVQIRQKPNEDPITYYYRVISVLNHLTNHLNLHEKNKVIKKNKIDTYNNQALRTLVVGLREPVQSMIRSLKPDTLAEALKYLTEDANIRYMSKNNQPLNNHNQKPMVRPITNNQYRPTSNSNFYRSLPPSRPQFYQQNSIPNTYFNNQFHHQNALPPSTSNNQFPRGPISNIRPMNLPPRRYPTNSQVFGRPPNTNVWKPKPNNNQIVAPTPMSINTRNTFQNPNYKLNPQQRPKYTFEELHNFENNENPDIYYQTQDDFYNCQENYSSQEPYYEEQNLETFFESNYDHDQKCDPQNEQVNASDNVNFRTSQPLIEET